MKFWTIWTIPAMSLRERMNRTGEWALILLASHMPRKLGYWVVIIHGSRYFEPTEVVPEVRFMDVVQRAGDDVMGASR
jgi:hypothetical protein